MREVLGKEVHQAGSLVAPERLRFDFSHRGPVAEGDLATIEEEINARIRENAGVTVERAQEVRKSGAHGIAAIRAFWDDAEPAQAARRLREWML